MGGGVSVRVLPARAAGSSRRPPPGGGGVGRVGAGVGARGATGGGVTPAAGPPRPRLGSTTVAEVRPEVGGPSTTGGGASVRDARAAAIISRPLWNRSAGSLASAFDTTSLRARGRSGRSWWSGGGG